MTQSGIVSAIKPNARPDRQPFDRWRRLPHRTSKQNARSTTMPIASSLASSRALVLSRPDGRIPRLEKRGGGSNALYDPRLVVDVRGPFLGSWLGLAF